MSGAAVSFGPRANVVSSGDYKIAAGSRSDAFFFDFDGIKNLFDTSGNTANVFSMAVELPTAELALRPELRI
ncbi:hypothetical protein SMD20_27575 [Nonomuraea sp. LP-02]|uniref:hypothetical protein n=1 Tax=Nonomuraea sp. LP-02 TaxID=3097960 RepID=UPI002E3083AD|nr:hypothetical protein [Nonomuraea sp. LP-02]MED7928050.1 hypothetical protein [Nonomuraea sp. LP-02]